MKSLLSASAALLLSLIAMTPSHAQALKLGEVLVFHLPDLRENLDRAALENRLATEIAPAWGRSVPGMEMHLVRADRGSGRGRYMLVWTADTQQRWSSYAAPAGAVPFSQQDIARMRETREAIAPLVGGEGRWREYHLLSPATVAELPAVDILGIHYIQVRPERREAFERFVAETLHPAVGALRPDLQLLYYKSVRGEDAGNYITIFALTNESRDRYWPSGADSDDVRAAFAPVARLKEELSTYLVEGSFPTGNLAASVFESREWTDFVHIPRTAP